MGRHYDLIVAEGPDEYLVALDRVDDVDGPGRVVRDLVVVHTDHVFSIVEHRGYLGLAREMRGELAETRDWTDFNAFNERCHFTV